MALNHYSKNCPKIFPFSGDILVANIDRAQGVDVTAASNREKNKELGRDGVIDYRKSIPSISYRLTQNEYGSFDFWKIICGKSAADTFISHNDFKTAMSDVLHYLTDDEDTFTGTIHYPKLRTSGFSLGIGDPEALVERTFDMVGDAAYTWDGNNKYVIPASKLVASGDLLSGNVVEITLGIGDYLNYPDAVADPDKAAKTETEKNIIKVYRLRGGDATELTAVTDYTYVDSTKKLTFLNALADDLYKFYYTATTYISGTEIFVNNDSNYGAAEAYYASIYLYVPASGKPATADYQHELQSVSVSVSFDRTDNKEIGSREVQQRGTKETTVTVTLGKFLDGLSLEEVLRNAGSNYGKYDVESFSDDLKLEIRLFSDKDKTAELIRYTFDNLSASEKRDSITVDEYTNIEANLEGEEILIEDKT